MLRVETLMWQQHTVSVKPKSLKLRDMVRAVTVSGETLAFPAANLIWVSQDKKVTRLCYQRLVVTGGTSNLIRKGKKGYLARFSVKGTGTTLIVNTKMHTLHSQKKD